MPTFSSRKVPTVQTNLLLIRWHIWYIFSPHPFSTGGGGGEYRPPAFGEKNGDDKQEKNLQKKKERR
jgi:hypothetical protein